MTQKQGEGCALERVREERSEGKGRGAEARVEEIGVRQEVSVKLCLCERSRDTSSA